MIYPIIDYFEIKFSLLKQLMRKKKQIKISKVNQVKILPKTHSCFRNTKKPPKIITCNPKNQF